MNIKFSFLLCKCLGLRVLDCMVPNFKSQTILQSNSTTLHSSQQCKKIPVALHSCQHIYRLSNFRYSYVCVVVSNCVFVSYLINLWVTEISFIFSSRSLIHLDFTLRSIFWTWWKTNFFFSVWTYNCSNIICALILCFGWKSVDHTCNFNLHFPSDQWAYAYLLYAYFVCLFAIYVSSFMKHLFKIFNL